jgi:hypothetical protein
LDEQLLLTLPHRQFVFSIPKALRIFFRHDQKLFASVSSLIFSLIRQFYRLAAGSPLLSTASIIALQPFGDFLRPNAHWHALVLEGGFSPDGRFLFLPIHDTQKLTEIFRRALITEKFASTLLCWKNSGFSVDNRVRIGAEDHSARVALAQYIARAPLSMDKLSYLPSQGTVRYTSDFNPAVGDTTKVWEARDFIAASTLFIRRAAAVAASARRREPPLRESVVFAISVCTPPAVAGSGPSGIMWSVTPLRGGRNFTARKIKILLLSRPPALCPSPLAAPHGRGSSRRSTRSTH